ncbi:MAG: hypothetical protein RLN60_04035 [Phycisphaerales bacterium]
MNNETKSLPQQVGRDVPKTERTQPGETPGGDCPPAERPQGQADDKARAAAAATARIRRRANDPIVSIIRIP